MTIDKAKRILGKDAYLMRDVEIQEIIDCFSRIIEVGFQLFEAKKNQNPFDKVENKET